MYGSGYYITLIQLGFLSSAEQCHTQIYEDDLNNEDDLKNDDNLENEDDHKTDDILENEGNLK